MREREVKFLDVTRACGTAVQLFDYILVDFTADFEHGNFFVSFGRGKIELGSARNRTHACRFESIKPPIFQGGVGVGAGARLWPL